VRYSLHGELVQLVRSERPHLEGAVRQLVIIPRLPSFAAPRKSHPRLPPGGQLGAHGARLLFPAHEKGASGSGIEERVRGIDVVRPDGQLEAREAVLDTHTPRARRRDAPRLLVRLLDRERPPVVVRRAKAVDMPLVLANQIAARSPDGKAYLQRRSPPGVRLERDLRAARLWLRDA
jgi:hypothetical protein